MTYDLDAAIRESKGKIFEFTVGGREFTLPHMKDVPKEVLNLGDDAQAILAQLRIALGGQWRVFDKVPLSVDAIEKLYSAWSDHSGVVPGESPASPR